jgi:hypothetical protein
MDPPSRDSSPRRGAGRARQFFFRLGQHNNGRSKGNRYRDTVLAELSHFGKRLPMSRHAANMAQ